MDVGPFQFVEMMPVKVFLSTPKQHLMFPSHHQQVDVPSASSSEHVDGSSAALTH